MRRADLTRQADGLEEAVSRLKPYEFVYGDGMVAEDLDVVADVLLAVSEQMGRLPRFARYASCARKALIAVDVARGSATKPEVLALEEPVCSSCGQKKDDSDFRKGPLRADGTKSRNRTCKSCVQKRQEATRSRNRPHVPEWMEEKARAEKLAAERKRNVKRAEYRQRWYQENRDAILERRRAAYQEKKAQSDD